MEGSIELNISINDAAKLGVDVCMGPGSAKTHALLSMLGFGLNVAESSYTAPNAGIALEQLHSVRNQILKILKTLRSPATISPELCEELVQARTFTEAEIWSIIADAEVSRGFSRNELLPALQYVYLHRSDSDFSIAESALWTLDRIADAIEYLASRCSIAVSTFCGITWAKRLWFLMHGSHPPKSECQQFLRQAFGSA